jgi:hypothetical protein
MKTKTWIVLIVFSGLLVTSLGVVPFIQPVTQAAAIVLILRGDLNLVLLQGWEEKSPRPS